MFLSSRGGKDVLDILLTANLTEIKALHVVGVFLIIYIDKASVSPWKAVLLYRNGSERRSVLSID